MADTKKYVSQQNLQDFYTKLKEKLADTYAPISGSGAYVQTGDVLGEYIEDNYTYASTTQVTSMATVKGVITNIVEPSIDTVTNKITNVDNKLNDYVPTSNVSSNQNDINSTSTKIPNGTAVNAAITAISNSITSTLNSSYLTSAKIESTYAKKTDISSAYKACGTITFADLVAGNDENSAPNLLKHNAYGETTSGSDEDKNGNEGNVYSVSDAFTIGDYSRYFVDSSNSSNSSNSSITYPAGTNVVIVAVEDYDATSKHGAYRMLYKFDILAGFIDTSSFPNTPLTDDDLSTILNS